MKKILVVSCAMLLIASSAAFAKTLPSVNSAKDLSTKIMAKVATGDLNAALEMIKPYTFISLAEMDAIIAQSKESKEKFGERNGKSIGYEFINSKRVGDSLLRFRYIEKNEKHALLWEFYFYNTKEGWILDSFNWSDVYKPLFEGLNK